MRSVGHKGVWGGVLLVSCLVVSCGQPASVTQPAPMVAATPAPSAAAPVTPPVVKLYQGTGVVKRTNPAFPSVELAHDAIPGLMPAMEMEFYVKDIALIKGLKPGTKVNFTLEDKGGAEMIIALAPR